MATYGEFSSLLQLGVGVGIGLSVFRAPVDLRMSKISRLVDGELTALWDVKNSLARDKRYALMSLKLRVSSMQDELNSRMLPFMLVAVVAALLNLAGLVKASLDATAVIPDWLACVLIFVSVINFLFIIAWLELLARRHLSPLAAEFERITAMKAN